MTENETLRSSLDTPGYKVFTAKRTLDDVDRDRLDAEERDALADALSALDELSEQV